MDGYKKTNSDRVPTAKEVEGIIKKAFSNLEDEAEILKGDIVEKFYSGQSKNSLGRRTGMAARGWRTISSGENTVSIINNVPYADQSKEKVITPKTKKFLAIPVGPALTKAGVARFKGPKDTALPKLRVAFAKKGNLLLLGKQNERDDKEEIYFVLAKKVTIPARTKNLTPFVKKRAKEIVDEIGIGILREWDAIARS